MATSWKDGKVYIMLRLMWLDVLKGWGILFIVLGHIVGAGVRLSDGVAQVVCSDAYKYFYAFHVPLFFFVAGITFREKKWGDFLKKKALRLLVPYFVIGGVSIITYWLLHDIGNAILQQTDTTGYYAVKAQYASIGAYLWTLMSGFIKGPMFAPNSVLWFIPALFSLEVIAQGVIRIIKSRGGWLMLGVLVWLVSCWSSVPELPWISPKLPYHFFFFSLGLFVCERGISLSRIWLFGLSMLLIVGFGILAVWEPYQHSDIRFLRQIFHLFVACGNIAGWFLFAKVWEIRWLAFLGVCSLGIMVLHKFPILFLQHALPPVRALFQGNVLELAFGVMLVFVGSMAITLIGYLACLRWCPFVFGNIKRPQFAYVNDESRNV